MKIKIRYALILTVIICILIGNSIALASKGTITKRYIPEVITSSGAWCWFADPRAVFSKRFSKTYMGWVDKGGSIIVSSYNHKADVKTKVNIRPNLQIDDHANPALLITPSGRITAFFSGHNGKEMYYRVSKKPGDITSWGAYGKVGVNKQGPLGYTYPNPQYLSDPKKVFLFWRGGNAKPTFSTTTDLKHWTPARTLITVPGRLQRPYLKIESNGKDTIHFAFTDGHPNEKVTSLYYFYYKNGSFYKADNTFIGTVKDLPIKPESADKIYDVKQNNKARAWVHDIAYDKSNKPVIVYATFPTFSNHRYRYVRWTGSAWFDKEIVEAGGPFEKFIQKQYSGGISLNHQDPSVVYLSRKVGKGFHLEKWKTLDFGNSWTMGKITQLNTINVRPFSPKGLGPSNNLEVMWMRGRYANYVKYETSLLTVKRTGNLNHPPEAVFRVSANKGKAPMTVLFNARPSKDRDGRIVRYRWNFRDGSRLKGSSKINHTFKKKGRYFVVLDVTDNKGKRDQYSREIIVH